MRLLAAVLLAAGVLAGSAGACGRTARLTVRAAGSTAYLQWRGLKTRTVNVDQCYRVLCVRETVANTGRTQLALYPGPNNFQVCDTAGVCTNQVTVN